MPPYFFSFTRFAFVLPLSPLGFPDVPLTIPYPAALAFGSVALYCFMIAWHWPRTYATQRARKAAKEPVPEPSFAFSHHALLCFYSAFACGAAACHVLAAGELSSLSAFACAPPPPWLRLVSLTFTLSKLWEWLDTAVLFARGGTAGGIGFLHCYHHATTFLLFLVVMNFPGAEKSGMLLNGFVHTLMYAHYAWRLPKVLRPLITALQIVQLAAVTALWAATPGLCGGAPAAFAKANPLAFATPFVSGAINHPHPFPTYPVRTFTPRHRSLNAAGTCPCLPHRLFGFFCARVLLPSKEEQGEQGLIFAGVCG
jgi:hypothetical protein